MKEHASIGFIGTGVMGLSMARNLMNAGHPLHVYNRTRSKAEPLLQAGAHWHSSAQRVAEHAQIVCTMLGFPGDVEQIYFGPEGLIEHSSSGAYLVDFTTSRPLLAQRIHQQAAERGVHALDAPVSGGDRGAREAKLSIMVGGRRQAFDALRALFEVLGSAVYQGPAGAGQHTKMSNQIAVASGMLGVCESLAYAQRAGLDPDTVLQSIAHGAAASWALSNMAPRILKGDFAAGFYVKHLIKDMGIAIESADQMGLELPGLALARQLYDRLAEQGHEDLGTQALYKLFS